MESEEVEFRNGNGVGEIVLWLLQGYIVFREGKIFFGISKFIFRWEGVNRNIVFEIVQQRGCVYGIRGKIDLGFSFSFISYYFYGFIFTWEGIYYEDDFLGFEWDFGFVLWFIFG